MIGAGVNCAFPKTRRSETGLRHAAGTESEENRG